MDAHLQHASTDDLSALAWVQLVGTVAVLDTTPAEVLDVLAARYPAYRERRPRGPFLRLGPERLVCWRASG